MILLVMIVICLYVVSGIFLFHTIPKHLEIYVKLLKMLTLSSLAEFCEVRNIFLDVKCHIIVEQISGKIVGLTIKASKLPKLYI